MWEHVRKRCQILKSSVIFIELCTCLCSKLDSWWGQIGHYGSKLEEVPNCTSKMTYITMNNKVGQHTLWERTFCKWCEYNRARNLTPPDTWSCLILRSMSPKLIIFPEFAFRTFFGSSIYSMTFFCSSHVLLWHAATPVMQWKWSLFVIYAQVLSRHLVNETVSRSLERTVKYRNSYKWVLKISLHYQWRQSDIAKSVILRDYHKLCWKWYISISFKLN